MEEETYAKTEEEKEEDEGQVQVNLPIPIPAPSYSAPIRISDFASLLPQLSSPTKSCLSTITMSRLYQTTRV